MVNKVSRKLLAALLAAVMLFSVAGEAMCQELGTQIKGQSLRDIDLPGLSNPVNLDALVPMDVVVLIDILAKKGNLKNVVIGNGISGKTAKFKFTDVTVAEALEVILSVNQLAYVIQGGIITIMTDEEYTKRYGVSFYDNKTAEIVELEYADAGNIATMLQQVKSGIGTIVSDKVTQSLILIDTPSKIAEMKEVIAKADIETITRVLPTRTATFVLQYADVETVKAEVATLLTAEAGSVKSDVRTKSLIVTDLPHVINKVDHLVEVFDRRQKQVFIEAKIIEVTLTDSQSLGINWDNLFDGLDPRFSVASAVTPGGPASPAGSLTYKTILGGNDLTMVVEALRQVGETKVLQNPQIAVMDGESATIKVIENQPYKEVELESGSTNITGVTYLFEEVGVTLEVTPKISDDSMISVKVKPEISTIADWYDGGVQEGTPVIKKSLAETSVMVKDGVTIIIGGMIREEDSTSKTSVPLLGSLPLIGVLFRYESEASATKETVVFLTPRIVSGEEPFQRMKDTKKQPKGMRTIEGKEAKPVR